MSAEPLPHNAVHQAAVILGMKGYKLIRVKRRSKVPFDNHWPDVATNDPATIDGWFDNDQEFNLGLACGLQPNGKNILAVDIDPKKGGDESWRALVAEHGKIGGVRHTTPSGGFHLPLVVPSEFRNTAGMLGPGIDTRGEAGQILLPPSVIIHEETGELRGYGAPPGVGLFDRDPIEAPAWLLERLTKTVQASVNRHPSRQQPRPSSAETPLEHLRRTETWESVCPRYGWQYMRTQGTDTYWCRPGKNPRDGHSAVGHEGGALVIFTTDIPQALRDVGTEGNGATTVSVSIPQFVAAYETGGDQAELARVHRAVMPPSPRLFVAGAGTVDPTTTAEPEDTHFPELVYARPWAASLRRSAIAQLAGPDVTLINVLIRAATMIPPSYRLPAVIGGMATFDLIGCSVAATSVGKSIGNEVARNLLTSTNELILWDQPNPSGEGIAQAFLGPEMEPDAKGVLKSTGKLIVVRQALHVLVDEAMAFVKQTERSGATILPTLNTAWSGGTLGQLNAKQENRRIVPGGRCRVTAMLNIQESNSWQLFDDKMTGVGFTGRLIFVRATNPEAPDLDDMPDWEGALTFPNLPIITNQFTVLSYDPAIVREIREKRLATLRGQTVDEVASHSMLVRCKIAGIFALFDGRLDVTIDDWAIAGAIVNTSNAVLRRLQRVRVQHERDHGHNLAVLRGEMAEVMEDTRERKAIARLSDTIVASCSKEWIGRNVMRKMRCSKETTHRFNPAVLLAVARGALEDDGQRIRLT